MEKILVAENCSIVASACPDVTFIRGRMERVSEGLRTSPQLAGQYMYAYQELRWTLEEHRANCALCKRQAREVRVQETRTISTPMSSLAEIVNQATKKVRR